MAVPIRLKNMPQHIRAQYGFPFSGTDSSIQRLEAQDRVSNDCEDLVMLKFPQTKVILWDHTATGPPVFLHVAQYRKPQISIPEKVLRLAQRHSESCGQSWNGVLIGSLYVDDDCEGVRFEIDRIDTSPKHSSALNSLAPGDVMVPVKVSLSSAAERVGTVEDYTSALKLLRERCRSKDSVDLTHFLLTKGWFTLYSSGEKCVAHLDFDIVTARTVFKAYPVASVPIVPTALSKNLAGPMSLSHVQGTPKSGYLTMDHTRKILLVLESDPKVYTLPIIGIWVSGVTAVHHPLIWASCLRYLHNHYMQDRVCCPPEQFLLVLYSPTHSKPEFYDVITSTGDSKLDFDVFTGYEVANIAKTVTSISSGIIDCDLSPVVSGPKREIFDAALSEFRALGPGENSTRKTPLCNTVSDDILPRSIPTPHQAKATHFQSMVPEVSLIFNDSQQSTPLSRALESIPEVPSLELSTPRNDSRHTSMNSSGAPYIQNNSIPNSYDNQQYTNSNGLSEVPFSQQNCVQNRISRNGMEVHQGFVHPHLVEKQFRNGGVNSQHMFPSGVNYATTSVGLYHQKGCACEFCLRNSAFGGGGQGCMAPNNPVSVNTNTNHTNAVSYNQTRSSGPDTVSNQFVSAPVRPDAMSNQFVSAPIRTHNPSSAQPRQSFPIPQPIMSPTYPQESLRMHAPVQGQICQKQSMSLSCPQVQSIRHRQIQPQSINQSLPEFPHPALHPSQPFSLPPQSNPVYVQQHQREQQHQIHSNSLRHPSVSQQNSTSSSLSVNTQAHCGSVTPQINQLVENHLQGYPGNHPQGFPGNHPQGFPANHLQVFPGFNQQQQVQNASLSSQDHTDHTESSCSGKSSDDSGLSVTPDRLHPSPKSHSPGSSNQAHLSGFVQTPSVDSINWDKVPPEIYQLIMQQNAQLQQLQSQMQALLKNQSTSQATPSSQHDSSTETTPTAENMTCKKPETCEMAVNTTLFSPNKSRSRPASLHSIQIQTSPQKLNFSSGSCSRTSSERTGEFHPDSETQTPVEMRHKGVVQLNSTQRDDTDSVDMNQADIAAVVNNMGIQNQTVDSIHSDIILDLPSYQSSPSRSDECKEVASMDDSNMTSPISASMCAQQEYGYSYTDADGFGAVNPATLDEESKEYYDKLLGNIRNFLNTHTVDTTYPTENSAAEGDVSDGNGHGLSKMAPSGLQSILQLQQFGSNADTTFIPKINYMSVMFDSDSDTSVDINAMAMKYLSDEQLTHMMKLQRNANIPRKTGLLRQVLRAENMSNVSQDVSRFGMSPNNITLDTKKYLEKYGLLNANETLMAENTNLIDQTLQLRLNFSTITPETGSPTRAASDEHFTRPYTNERGDAVFTPPDRRNNVRRTHDFVSDHPSPVQNFPSPQRVDNYQGLSPVFPVMKNQPRPVQGSPESPPVLPVANRQYAHRCSPPQSGSAVSDHCGYQSPGYDQDNILDIHKLRQLPKLL
ncbi:SCL-interrupting locus protein homolog [Gigantopelta aegis]|uniref:SCL-interrupting locus protein homolog n=1 Tax=Gigantopelta aegis TaxID=1735272 RepID=UPI001B8889D8|nr:SCL-interrupting locus protein homolog [Gigantopelta aegis]